MRVAGHYRPESVTSRDPGRPALAEVWFDADERVVYASDSFIAICIPVEETGGDDTSGTVPVAALKAARNLGRGIELTEDAATVGGFAAFVRMNGVSQLPLKMLRDAVPSGEPITTVGFDLALLQRAAEALGGGKMRLDFYNGPNGGSEQAIRLTRLDDPDAWAIVMPVRRT